LWILSVVVLSVCVLFVDFESTNNTPKVNKAVDGLNLYGKEGDL
jgi:hypothetical protein